MKTGCVCRHGVYKRDVEVHMTREKLTYKLTFRIDYETWIRLETAARDSGVRPSDWVRELTIGTLARGFGLNPSQRILLEQFVRTQYLVANGFQLLADNKLTSEEWKRFRASAKEKINVITDRALADYRSRKNVSAGIGNSARDDQLHELSS